MLLLPLPISTRKDSPYWGRGVATRRKVLRTSGSHHSNNPSKYESLWLMILQIGTSGDGKQPSPWGFLFIVSREWLPGTFMFKRSYLLIIKLLYKLSTWTMKVLWLPKQIFLLRCRSTQTPRLKKKIGPRNLASQMEKLYSRTQLTWPQWLFSFIWKSGNYLIRENSIFYSTDWSKATHFTELPQMPGQVHW